MLKINSHSGSFKTPMMPVKKASSSAINPANLNPIHLPINYDQDLALIKAFMAKFECSTDELPKRADDADAETMKDGDVLVHKYRHLMQLVVDLKLAHITVDLDDLLSLGDDASEELVDRIMQNTYRYQALFCRAVDEMMPERSAGVEMTDMDAISTILEHRKARIDARKAERAEKAATSLVPMAEREEEKIPPALLRRYSLSLRPSAKQPSVAVRQVKSSHVGAMVTIRGIMTRVSEVKPLLQVGTYTCDKCEHEVYQEVASAVFMPVLECPSEKCRLNNSKGQLFLQTRGSRFVKFQEGRMQEMADQVPMGHIPRSMAVHFMGDLARQAAPGDLVVVSGIFMPRPYTGFKAIKAGLLTDTYLLAQHIVQVKASICATPTDEAAVMLASLHGDPSVYGRLASSIAPEIYGHDDVKKAILLLMVGGMDRTLADGMRIRGDVNLCLMGDPGVAKSQLLKWVAKTALRAVYTTGKGSSGVGLTAAVTRDPVTNEMVLEGGALVLADNGICCIDEFDKMDESDRTSIHEVMEQQTISIAKAGITTTLNARASILAAANPLYGRYNPKRSPRENINLPPALLSRFDLLFLILDTPNHDTDTRLAEHVCHVHRTGQPLIRDDAGGDAGMGIVTPDVFRRYIAEAKKLAPLIPEQLVEYIVSAYTSLRAGDLQAKDASYTTARTLLAILRLSQALAKLHLRDLVCQEDVDEAIRLMAASRSSVDSITANRTRTFDRNADPITRLYTLIRTLAQSHSTASEDAADNSGVRLLPIDLIRERVHRSGFDDLQLQQCLVDFDAANVWSVSEDGTMLRIYN